MVCGFFLGWCVVFVFGVYVFWVDDVDCCLCLVFGVDGVYVLLVEYEVLLIWMLVVEVVVIVCEFRCGYLDWLQLLLGCDDVD